MKMSVSTVYREPGAKCQICGGTADLTLKPGNPNAPGAPPPLDLCHPCAQRFITMLRSEERAVEDNQMSMETLEKWLPIYVNSFGGLLRDVPEASVAVVLRKCAEYGAEVEVNPLGNGFCEILIKGKPRPSKE